MNSPPPPRNRNGFKLAIICALRLEAESVRAVFDRCWEREGHTYGKTSGDQNTYQTGAIGRHNVVLVLLPSMGSVPAAQAAGSLRSSFPNIDLVFVVGVCGAMPDNPETKEKIFLGDVIVSTGVIQYDYGSTYPNGFQRKTSVQDGLRKAPKEIQAFLNTRMMRQNREYLRMDLAKVVVSEDFQKREPTAAYPIAARDRLYDSSYVHQHRPLKRCDVCHPGATGTCSLDCSQLGCEEDKIIRTRPHSPQSTCTPNIHFGRYGSANTVMKCGINRNELALMDGLIALEMEGAGVWDQFATIVIKGACDYADSHKNKTWQPYAAMMAAVCFKLVLQEWVAADELVDRAHSLPSFQEQVQTKSLGLCLAPAPLIKSDEFVGRAVEIDAIHSILYPDPPSSEQHRAVVGGIGGVGKTQLAIAYARKHQRSYTSILWLNATSEQTIYDTLRSDVVGLFSANELTSWDNEQLLARVHEWLCQPTNIHWLLIFDNYDNPDQYDLNRFCPSIGHGSIIVTSRLPDDVTGQQVRVQHLAAIDDSLQILQSRSGRNNVTSDTGAHRLADRLAGFPLALVTAGAYLRKSSITFQQYLDAYEERWRINPRRPLELQEYRDRTLYTTWNLSYNKLKEDSPEAAQMLKLLAYFDNQDIWYDLFHAGLSEQLPSWLQSSVRDQINFESVMSTLVEYCLVEVQYAIGSYTMHSCVHDWTLGELNQEIDPKLYWYALDCIAAKIDKQDEHMLQYVLNGRLSHHGVRLTHARFESVQSDPGFLERLDNLSWVAYILHNQYQLVAAERMYTMAIAGDERVRGIEHEWTLTSMNRLGLLYSEQNKLDQAEKMYQRVLAGREKVLGLDDSATLDSLNDLAILYHDQGRLDKAEELYRRVLSDSERLLGPDHPSTLSSIHNLGGLYYHQRKYDEAINLYQQVLAGKERVLGRNHPSTFNAVDNLGNVYYQRGKYVEAERFYRRALDEREKTLGFDHPSTLTTAQYLGRLYCDQGKLDKADELYRRGLVGREKHLGRDNPLTLKSVCNLACLRHKQGQLIVAERLFQRALAGQEKIHGLNDATTLATVSRLGVLYSDQGKLDEAKRMFLRILSGASQADSVGRRSIRSAARHLRAVYYAQGKHEEGRKVEERYNLRRRDAPDDSAQNSGPQYNIALRPADGEVIRTKGWLRM